MSVAYKDETKDEAAKAPSHACDPARKTRDQMKQFAPLVENIKDVFDRIKCLFKRIFKEPLRKALFLFALPWLFTAMLLCVRGWRADRRRMHQFTRAFVPHWHVLHFMKRRTTI